VGWRRSSRPGDRPISEVTETAALELRSSMPAVADALSG
jgi:hypothetical protein